MKIINRSKNTIYVDDADLYIKYNNEEPEALDTETIKKSKTLRNFILSPLIDIYSYDPKERIEASLAYLKKKTKTHLEKSEKTLQKEIEEEPISKTFCNNIEVKLHGLFYDASGYAKVNRNIATKLHEAGVKLQVIAKRSENQLNEDEINPLKELTNTKLSKDAILIDSIVPSFAEFTQGKYKILYTTIESYTIPQQFIDSCALYNEIWITSPWSKEILSKYIKDKPIHVMPAGVDHNLYTENGPKYDLQNQVKNFVFISVFGWGYRKGYDVLLKSYFDEFNSEDDVSLLLVSRYQTGTSRTHKEKIKKDIEHLMTFFPNKDLPHVVRYNKITPEKDMPKLYRAANCFILPTRAEGSCCVPGTQIITKNGIKKIENIDLKDNVLTDCGVFRKITETMTRQVDEDIYGIHVTKSFNPIFLTKDHPVLTISKEKIYSSKKNPSIFNVKNAEWIRAENLKVGDYLIYPINFAKNESLDSISISSYLNTNNVIYDNNLLYRKIRHQNKIEYKHNDITPVSDEIKLTYNCLRLIGLYIAGGWNAFKLKKRHGSIYFSINSKEIVLRDFIYEAWKEIFKKEMKIIYPNYSGREFRCNLIACNSIIAEFLTNLVGVGAKNKHLPDFTWKLSKQQRIALLHGLFEGDEYLYNNKEFPCLSLSTVSETLADEVFILLKSIGIMPDKQKVKNRGFLITIKGKQLNDLGFKRANYPSNKRIITMCVKKDEYVYIPIKKIIRQNYVGPVYNLEVEDHHSYTTSEFTVHNCLPPLEASLCGLPVIMTNCSGQQMYLREDNAYLIDVDKIEKIQPGQMHIHYWDNQEFPSLTSQSVLDQTKRHMRTIYENFNEAKKRNIKMKKLIIDNFTWDHTISKMLKRLKEIKEKIG